MWQYSIPKHSELALFLRYTQISNVRNRAFQHGFACGSMVLPIFCCSFFALRAKNEQQKAIKFRYA
jgi:hypothetical protein